MTIGVKGTGFVAEIDPFMTSDAIHFILVDKTSKQVQYMTYDWSSNSSKSLLIDLENDISPLLATFTHGARASKQAAPDAYLIARKISDKEPTVLNLRANDHSEAEWTQTHNNFETQDVDILALTYSGIDEFIRKDQMIKNSQNEDKSEQAYLLNHADKEVHREL